MIFRNGHISGFIDELADSLWSGGANQIDLLSEYHEEVSLGASDIQSLIPIPILFVFLQDSSSENNVTILTAQDRTKIKDELLFWFNEAAAKLNIKFFPAIKKAGGSEDNIFLDTPGIDVLEMKDQTSLKEYQDYDPTLGGITISQYHNYLEHGIAIASEKFISGGASRPIKGVPHQDVTQRLLDELSIDFTKVYTVVLSNKLNTEGMTDTEPGWAAMTCTHPATRTGKHYVSFFSIPHLRNEFLDTLSYVAPTINEITENYNSTYPDVTPITISDLDILSPELLMGHLIGNTFGLLPIGTPNITGLFSNSSANCNSTECILLGGNGNCIDVAPLVSDNYFSEYLTTTPWAFTEEDVCPEDIPLADNMIIPVYQSVGNYMNFWNIIDNSLAKNFTSSQINYVRAGFETSGSVLKILKDNAVEFIDTQANNEVYCANYQPTYEARPLKLNFKFIQRSQSVESLNFEKIKSKIISICNKLIYR